MKKIICSAALICLVLSAVFCKSAKADKKASKKKNKKATAVEAPAEVNAAESAEAAAKADAILAEGGEEGLAGEAADASAKNADKDGKDYTGWIKSTRRSAYESRIFNQSN